MFYSNITKIKRKIKGYEKAKIKEKDKKAWIVKSIFYVFYKNNIDIYFFLYIIMISWYHNYMGVKIMEREIPTKNKIMIPVRISDQLYKKMRIKVNNKKDKERGYSINKYIAELIEENTKQVFWKTIAIFSI